MKIRSKLFEELSKALQKDPNDLIVSVPEAQTNRNSPHDSHLLITRERMAAIGDCTYADRMRLFLIDNFPEAEEIPPDELEQQILELTERASWYKLILETQVAPFIVSAWVLGLNFDEEYLVVKDVLEDLDMDSNAKAEWLWQFMEQAVGILEGEDSE